MLNKLLFFCLSREVQLRSSQSIIRMTEKSLKTLLFVINSKQIFHCNFKFLFLSDDPLHIPSSCFIYKIFSIEPHSLHHISSSIDFTMNSIKCEKNFSSFEKNKKYQQFIIHFASSLNNTEKLFHYLFLSWEKFLKRAEGFFDELKLKFFFASERCLCK